MSGREWWQQELSEDEQVLWSSPPSAALVPPRFKWLYYPFGIIIPLLWMILPFDQPTAWDFWKLLLVTAGCALGLWGHQYVRRNCRYAVTTRNAWELNKFTKSKHLPIDMFLHFKATRHGVDFERHPSFSFDHLSDPDAAVRALKQAQEAHK